MSKQPEEPARLRTAMSIPAIRARKGGQKLAVLTAYTAPMADILAPHADVLLVGDSLGMVVYGFDSTLPVTLEMMIAHSAAVVRGAAGRVTVVVDLPFASYQASPQQAFESAARVMQKTGAAAVKLEGGAVMAPTISFLVQRGIPVMGHVGLTPQSVHQLGGYQAQGRAQAAARAILSDAQAVAQAGAFAIVIEGVVRPLADEITAQVPVPTIGIGASPSCDGQVLVSEDMLGLFPRTAKFVKRYAMLRETISAAAAEYAQEVHNGRFPDAAHCYEARPETAPASAKPRAT